MPNASFDRLRLHLGHVAFDGSFLSAAATRAELFFSIVAMHDLHVEDVGDLLRLRSRSMAPRAWEPVAVMLAGP